MPDFKCTRCGKVKPITSFSVRSAIKRGHRSSCKICDNEYYNVNHTSLLEKKRKYNKRPEVIARNKRLQDWYSAHKTNNARKVKPHKWSSLKYYPSVSAAVYRAKKTGALIKPAACEHCEIVTEKLQAHHDDYSKPLEVNWLCIKCHMEKHGKHARK